jgi:hypothetical protein
LSIRRGGKAYDDQRSFESFPSLGMTSRREFLKVGLTASALLPVGARASFDGLETRAPIHSLYKVLCDTRFAASVAFARRAAARGVAVHAMTGDMTPFWYDDLYHRWRQGPVAIGGLTAHGALFCLERLAWEHRMRVIYCGEHAAAGGGAWAHRFEGPAPLASAAAGATFDDDWASALADIVVACPRGREEAGIARSSTVGVDAAAPPEPLFSWVIARVPRA